MNRERQLVKNTVIVAIGKICTQFISFFLLPLYTSLLSTKEYGSVDLLNTYVSLLLPIIFLQIDQAIFRHLIDVRNSKKEQEKLISTTLITVFIQAILFLLIYLVIGQFIKNEYKYFLATNVVASMFSAILLQISRGLGDNATYSEGSLVSGAGTVILNVLFIWKLKLGAYGMLSATLIANVLCSLFVFMKKKIYKYLSIKNFSKGDLKQLWKYSIPLVPNQLSWWIINASDRTIVTYVLGVTANGIYSASNKISSICVTLFGIFNMTWAESASMYINDNDSAKYLSNIINIAIKLFTSLCLGIIAFMPFVFKYLITGEGYATAYYQIPILMLSTIFNIVVSLIGSIYVALKKSNEIAKTSIYSAIINIVVNLCLIKFIGLYAASISTLLAYFTMSIYRYIDVQKYVKIKVDTKFILISIPVISTILVIYYLRSFYLCFIAAIISVVFALYFNMDILKSILKTVQAKKNKYIKNCDNNSQMDYELNKKELLIKNDNNLILKKSDELLSLKDDLIPVTENNNLDNIKDLSYNKENNKIDDDINLIVKEVLDKNNISQYNTKEELINSIRKDNNYIKDIDFNKKYDFDIVELILEETKIYNFNFNNNNFLRNNKYPTILSNSYKFMRYVIDQDINNLAYIDLSNIDNNSLKKIIDYTFRKVYYLQKEGNNITFDINRIFINSAIIHNEYFKECLKYIKK